MEFVVAKIEGGVDGLEGLKVDVHLLFLPLCGKDSPAINHEAIVGDPVVKLQPLLGGSDGTQHGQTIDSALDIGGCSKLIACPDKKIRGQKIL